MADVIGTASAVVGLIDATITLIQAIRKARDSVKGTTKTLENLSTQLDTVSVSLQLVKKESRLQTSSIENQLAVILQVVGELKEFFDKIQAYHQSHAVRQFAHALKSGDRDEKDLADILGRLADVRLELLVRMSLVHVGLSGNICDGFEVAQREVMEMNEKMKRILGVQLVIAERLEAKQVTTTGQNIVRLDDTDVIALKLDQDVSDKGQQGSSKSDNNKPRQDIHNLHWQRNKTKDNTKLMIGNIGIEENGNAAVVRATVEDSEFGNDLKMIVGNYGKHNASGFNESFWN